MMSTNAPVLSEGLNLLVANPSEALVYFTGQIFSCDDLDRELESASSLWLRCLAADPVAEQFMQVGSKFPEAIKYLEGERVKMQEGVYDTEIDSLLDSLLNFLKAALQITKFHLLLQPGDFTKIELEILFEIRHCEMAIKALGEANPSNVKELEYIRQLVDRDRLRYA